jgi:hypothetical protein
VLLAIIVLLGAFVPIAEQPMDHARCFTAAKAPVTSPTPMPMSETRDAIKDHNDIRDAVTKVAGHAPGSGSWFGAIAAARKANSDRMGEEEPESLADFRRHAPLSLRHALAVALVRFEAR